MTAVRGMLARVAKLEAARRPRPSPFADAFGSFDAFRAKVLADMESGTLGTDFPLPELESWERNEVWGQWRRNGVWHAS